MKKKKNTSPCRHTLSVTMMIALLSILAISMSACGSVGTSTPGTSTGSSGSTNTTVATTPGLPRAGTSKSQNCGTINIKEIPQGNTSNTQVAGNCLWHAYQKCQSAVLVARILRALTQLQREHLPLSHLSQPIPLATSQMFYSVLLYHVPLQLSDAIAALI